MMSQDRFQSFEEFYPFYLSEHSDPRSRLLHYIGSVIAILLAFSAFTIGPVWLLAGVPFSGYVFAWIGHFLLERNQPATFRHPFWSLMGDYKMLWQAITGTLDRRHFNRDEDQSR